MINLTSNFAKRRARIYIERQMQNLERIFSREMEYVLNAQFKLASQLIAMGIRDYNHAVNDKEKYIRKYIYENYVKIYVNFGEIIFKSLNDAGIIKRSYGVYNTKVNYNYFIKSIKDEYEKTMDIWAQVNAAKEVYNINSTTKSTIARILKKGLAEGKSNSEIAEDIRKTSTQINAARAMKIARTETHTAAMCSMSKAMNTTRLKYTKTWTTAGDSRVRTIYKGKGFSHVAADGETVEKEEYYVRTGESLFYPGDIAASAGNRIHCRCIETYNIKSSDNIGKPGFYNEEEA